MPALPFRVAVLLSLSCYVGGSGRSNITEEDPTSLQYVYAFFRHGIRTPLYAPYPNDPNKSKYHKYLPGPPGELSKIGKQQMYNVGKKLKMKYGQFLGPFTDENVHISSTDTSRTIMTAQVVMAGLFPPSKPILKNLKWQPVPVWQDSTVFDKAYIYNDKNFPELGIKECPTYGALIKKGYDKTLNPDDTKSRQILYKLLINYTGNPDVNSVNNLYTVWDTLQFESLNGLPLPSWAIEPQAQYRNKPLYPDLMQPIMVEWFRDTEYLNQNQDMLQFYSGPIFNTVHENMRKTVKMANGQEKMRFHATHDTTLYVILWALGLKAPAVVGPGDGILFELHNDVNKPVVKVLYYDGKKDDINELILPHCPSPCGFDQFIKSTQALTPQQWQYNCQH